MRIIWSELCSCETKFLETDGASHRNAKEDGEEMEVWEEVEEGGEGEEREKGCGPVRDNHDKPSLCRGTRNECKRPTDDQSAVATLGNHHCWRPRLQMAKICWRVTELFYVRDRIWACGASICPGETSYGAVRRTKKVFLLKCLTERKIFGQNKTFGNPSFGQPGTFGGGETVDDKGGTTFGSAGTFGGGETVDDKGGTTFGGVGNMWNTRPSKTARRNNKANPGFGTASTGGFATPAPGGLFGGTNTATPSGDLFGSQPADFGAAPAASSFGFRVVTAATSGTMVKFTPPAGTEMMLNGGSQLNMNTRHQCITAMKEYESKSLEELRLEDYTANRKGVQQGSATIFGAAQPAQTPGFSFGQAKTTTFTGGFGAAPASTGLFGAQTTQPQGSTTFGGATAVKPVFGTATTSSAAAPAAFGSFGTNTGTSLFGGANTQQKSIFGQTITPQAEGLLGGTQTSAAYSTSTGFGTSSVFGATTQANSHHHTAHALEKTEQHVYKHIHSGRWEEYDTPGIPDTYTVEDGRSTTHQAYQTHTQWKTGGVRHTRHTRHIHSGRLEEYDTPGIPDTYTVEDWRSTTHQAYQTHTQWKTGGVRHTRHTRHIHSGRLEEYDTPGIPDTYTVEDWEEYYTPGIPDTYKVKNEEKKKTKKTTTHTQWKKNSGGVRHTRHTRHIHSGRREEYDTPGIPDTYTVEDWRSTTHQAYQTHTQWKTGGVRHTRHTRHIHSGRREEYTHHIPRHITVEDGGVRHTRHTRHIHSGRLGGVRHTRHTRHIHSGRLEEYRHTRHTRHIHSGRLEEYDTPGIPDTYTVEDWEEYYDTPGIPDTYTVEDGRSTTHQAYQTHTQWKTGGVRHTRHTRHIHSGRLEEYDTPGHTRHIHSGRLEEYPPIPTETHQAYQTHTQWKTGGVRHTRHTRHIHSGRREEYDTPFIPDTYTVEDGRSMTHQAYQTHTQWKTGGVRHTNQTPYQTHTQWKTGGVLTPRHTSNQTHTQWKTEEYDTQPGTPAPHTYTVEDWRSTTHQAYQTHTQWKTGGVRHTRHTRHIHSGRLEEYDTPGIPDTYTVEDGRSMTHQAYQTHTQWKTGGVRHTRQTRHIHSGR
ncbi:hypothetical protein LSAT2_012752 [Lamellibrachia satsuma]|nr:hypothetical protein LSAT2_012752 [Lamellibrachia satsuma]